MRIPQLNTSCSLVARTLEYKNKPLLSLLGCMGFLAEDEPWSGLVEHGLHGMLVLLDCAIMFLWQMVILVCCDLNGTFESAVRLASGL